MAIGDKKSVLRGMYNNPDPTLQPSPPPTPAVPRLEARLDSLNNLVVHSALYLLFLIGLAAIVATLYGLYASGLALEPTAHGSKYFRDGLYLFGLTFFLILIGSALFAFFKDKLPRRARWVAFSALLSIFPLAIISILFFSVAFSAGRKAAFSRLDHDQLLSDALNFAALSPLTNNEPIEIIPASPLFPLLPKYSQEHLHPESIHVFPHGIILFTESDPYNGPEGLIIPTEPLSPADARKIADDQSFHLVSANPPLFHFTATPNTKFLEAPRRPSTLPAFP